MESSLVRIGMICLGIILIIISVRLNSIKKILVNHAVIWSLIGIVMILTGVIPILSSWTRFLGPGTVAVLFVAGILVTAALYQQSLALSQVTLKNRELAMHVALLNQECEQLIGKVKKLESLPERKNEKDTVHG